MADIEMLRLWSDNKWDMEVFSVGDELAKNSIDSDNFRAIECLYVQHLGRELPPGLFSELVACMAHKMRKKKREF